MTRRMYSLFVSGLLLVGGCQALGRTGMAPDRPAQLFDGMGKHHRPISTASPQAQRYFDQGLVWTFAFNHDEAIRSYTEAARLDPDCAMAWWGVALCRGPHINNPKMDAEKSKAAWTALQRALALKDRANATERALIEALAKRYAERPPADRKPLDEAYAMAMRQVWKSNPKDADVGVLYAESMMDLRPWDLWTQDKKPHPGTEEIIAVLDAVLQIDPDHPGGNHLYIHAVEASPSPARANAAADRIRKAVPASGHLVHMPSHIDVLTGRWALASEQNERAVEIDRNYRALSPKQGFYRIYMGHNQHMLAFASMMEGRSEAALAAARAVVNSVPKDYGKKEAALVDPVMGAPYDVLKRFGKWEQILQEPAPPSHWPITRAMWRFSRGLAYAAQHKIADAESERSAFRKAVAKVPKDATLGINPAHLVLDIAEHMLSGEIAFAAGSTDEAVIELRKAVELEDTLKYTEPPEWIQPVRHTLGAVLTGAGRFAEAEKVYRDDLGEWPENGWSLYGLAKCLRAKGETAEADAVEHRFRKVWARADIQIGSSCLCVPGA